LFSGGVDSLTGILRVPQNLAATAGVFVSHSNSMAGCVKDLQTDFLNARRVTINKVGIQHGRHGLQQMRGFTYLTMGAIIAKMHGTDNIVVSETGQTMFLPPLAALDEITTTTHPTLIELTKSVLRECYGINFNVFEPFSDLTKAEVVSLCDAKEAIPATNSCINSQFANQKYSHCGTCYGCLVRRVGCLVAGVEDAEYAADVLVKDVGDEVKGRVRGQAIQRENLADLQALLRSARDVLDDELDEATRLKIASFSKEDLYRRAAIDVLVAIYLLYERTGQGHNPLVRKFYVECKEGGLISSEIAGGRMAEVREQRHQPDFDAKL
jgi:7-cyano-7-deazaguanine synthase in queuosine biosynthesis